MKNSHVLDTVALIILLVGGLNWGLIGLFQWDFIGSVFGFDSVLTRVIYSLAGFSAVYRILCWVRHHK